MPDGSLTSALRASQTGLTTSLVGIQVTSNNMVNINTDGYSKQKASITSNGEGAGVRAGVIKRITDEKLVSDIQSATADAGQYEAKARYLNRMDSLLGNPNGETAFTKRLTKLTTAIQAVSTSPLDSALHRKVVNAAMDFATSMNSVANGLQSIRSQVDQEISDSVNIINQELANIADLNQKIVNGNGTGQSVAYFEDQRDQSVGKIGDLIGVKTYMQENGNMAVFMNNGSPLFNQFPHTVRYTPAVSMDPSVSYPSSGISGIMLSGTDITAQIITGKVKGLIDLRDTILPNHQAELDSLTQTMCTQVNAVHNQGTGFPPPSQLSGTKVVNQNADLTGTGTGSVRIAFLDNLGKFSAPPIDIDLTQFTLGGDSSGGIAVFHGPPNPPPTVTTLISLINTSANRTVASLNSSGALVLSGGTSNISITSLSGPAEISGIGFSAYFGLNDFFVAPPTTPSTPNVGMANTLSVRADIVQNPEYLACGSGNTISGMDVSVPPNTGEPVNQIGISKSKNDIALSLLNTLTQNSTTFQAAGNLRSYQGSFMDYTSTIITLISTDANESSREFKFNQSVAENLQERLNSLNGVNEEQELSNLILFQQTYKASAKMMKTIDDLLGITLDILR